MHVEGLVSLLLLPTSCEDGTPNDGWGLASAGDSIGVGALTAWVSLGSCSF